MKRSYALAALCVVIGCTDNPVAPLQRAPVAVAAPILSPVTAGGATVTDLGTAAGFASSIARSISANGMIVGSASGGTPGLAALLFNPPALVYDQTQFPNDHAIEGLSTNDLGQVAGYGIHDFRNRTYVGAAGWLPLLPGGVNQFGGYLNNGGEVVGMTTYDATNALPRHATLWLPGEEYTAVDLGTFGGQSLEPLAMAPNMLGDFRIIVGRYSASAFSGYTAVVWQNGSWSQLPGPANCARNYTQANDVSDNGIIVGGEFFCGDGAVIWENGQLRSLPDGTEARGITTLASGRILIVGTSNTGQPVVWYDDGRGGFIGQLLPVLSGHSGGDAYDVNAFGQIVGRTGTAGGASRAVIWNFTPPDLTLPGSNVTVIPIDAARGLSGPVSVNFATVTGAGITSVTSGLIGDATAPPAPQGFQLLTPARYYEVATTATVTAPITVCVGYGGIVFAVEANLRLLHGNGSGGWTDVTTSQDQVGNRICGVVSSLSPFIVVELANIPPVPVNLAPIAGDDAAETSPLNPVVIDVLDNDSDPDGNTVRVTSVGRPGHGIAHIHGGRKIVYTPGLFFTGVDAFTYRISDGQGGTAVATVTVRVIEPRADLALHLEADVKVTSFSKSVTVTVNESNFGPRESPLAVLEIPRVHGLTFVSDENGYCLARQNGTVSCLLGSLESGADRSRLRLKFRANSLGTYMISGKVTGFLKDPVNGNNVAIVEAVVR